MENDLQKAFEMLVEKIRQEPKDKPLYFRDFDTELDRIVEIIKLNY